MWLATKQGWFSIAESQEDKGMLMVRARAEDHLERLMASPDWLAHAGRAYPILALKNRDYQYRIIVPRDIVGAWIGAYTANIDYSNFKNAAAREHGHSSEFVSFLHTTWSTALRMVKRNYPPMKPNRAWDVGGPPNVVSREAGEAVRLANARPGDQFAPIDPLVRIERGSVLDEIQRHPHNSMSHASTPLGNRSFMREDETAEHRASLQGPLPPAEAAKRRPFLCACGRRFKMQRHITQHITKSENPPLFSTFAGEPPAPLTHRRLT